MIKEHVEAFLTLARGDAELGTDVYEGRVGGRPDRYANVYSDNGGRDFERLDFKQIKATFSFTVHSVGDTPESARWVADRVFAQVLGVRPTIAGRTSWPIRHATSQPVQEDRDLSPDQWFGVDVFELTTTPAKETP